MDSEEKASSYYEKGIKSFENQSYREALHFFTESQKLKQTNEVQEYINKCKQKIEETKKEKENENNTESSQGEAKSNDDEECEKIIKSHDYYQILGITKEASPDEMKKAYKKMAIKFHPDKNHSSKAEEAFKKIATAYQTLSDPEKKKLFDKYGSEEEYREKVYQAHKQQYEEEEEIDPFDIFQMFMGGGIDQRTLERIRRQNRARAANAPVQNPRMMRIMGLVQLLPLVLMLLYYILPPLLEKKELYSYQISYEYPYKKTTAKHKVPFYVGNQFLEKYNGKKKELLEEEDNIEKKYLTYLNEACEENTQLKKKIEYHLKFYRKGSMTYEYYKSQLNSLDMEVCDKYVKYKDRIK